EPVSSVEGAGGLHPTTEKGASTVMVPRLIRKGGGLLGEAILRGLGLGRNGGRGACIHIEITAGRDKSSGCICTKSKIRDAPFRRGFRFPGEGEIALAWRGHSCQTAGS